MKAYTGSVPIEMCGRSLCCDRSAKAIGTLVCQTPASTPAVAQLGPTLECGPVQRATAAEIASISSWSSRSAAAVTLASRCARVAVPGIGGVTGEIASSQASAT